MLYLTLLLLAFSLSMDTLAISISTGICKTGLRSRHVLKIAVVFAFFQTLMPAAGYLAGSHLLVYIQAFAHWIAFALLALIGGKLIYENRCKKLTTDEDLQIACNPHEDPTSLGRLVLLAIVTSIDALAAGISLAIDDAPIVAALAIIGFVTFAVAMAGATLGKRLGVLFQRNACIVGGVVLILIGVKTVAERLLL